MTAPAFTTAERDRRWGLADALMARHGLDALLVYGDREGAFPASFAPDVWFTNDRGGSVVIKPAGAEPISIAFLTTVIEDQIQAMRRGVSGWVTPGNVYTGKIGPNLVQVLQERRLNRGRIGVVGLEPYPPFYFDGPMPYAMWSTVLEELPDVEFVPVQGEFFALTAAHSEEELAVLRWSASVGEAMCEAMRQASRPGARESDVYAAATATCAERAGYTTGILLGSGPEFVGWGPPPWNYRPAEPRTLQDGDVVLAEVFASAGMLETQHQPMIAVGEVHPDFERAAAAAERSYRAGVATLRAGTTFGEVVAAMRQPMREVDGWQVHPLIHGINPFGLIGTGDRMADLPETARFAQVLTIPSLGMETVLEPGMSFALEPNCALGSRVANLGGTVVVGADGGVELDRNTTRMMRAGG